MSMFVRTLARPRPGWSSGMIHRTQILRSLGEVCKTPVLTSREGRRLDRQRRPVAQSLSLRVPPEVIHGVQFRGRSRE